MIVLLTLCVFLALNVIPRTQIFGWGLAVVALFILLIVRNRGISVPRDLAVAICFPLLLLCTGLHGLYNHPLSDVLKDMWYFSGPIVYISFGYLIFERLGRWGPILYAFLVFGVAETTYSLINVFVNRNALLSSVSIDSYRETTGTGSLAAVVPMMLVLLMRHLRLPTGSLLNSVWVRAGLYVLVTASIVLTLSRTLIVLLVSGLVVIVNPHKLKRLTMNQLLFGVIALAAAGAGVMHYVKNEGGITELFVNKVLNTNSEVKVRAYETYQEINENWRGFEAYRAAQAYDNLNAAEKMFGGGFGSLVDLGFAMQLGPGQEFQFIPVLHNGYMYLLVKTGFLGLTWFVLFIVQNLFTGLRVIRSKILEARMAGLIILWSCLVFLFTQGVITGIYNKAGLAPNLLILGAACASLSMIQVWVEKTHGTAKVIKAQELIVS
jgi:hypothetical protein